MRVQSIKVKNYKCLENFEWNDIPPFCVIIGENGSGKSTLLGVLDFVRDIVSYGTKYAVDAGGGFENLITSGKNDEQIEIKLSFLDNANNSRIDCGWEINEDTGKNGKHLAYSSDFQMKLVDQYMLDEYQSYVLNESEINPKIVSEVLTVMRQFIPITKSEVEALLNGNFISKGVNNLFNIITLLYPQSYQRLLIDCPEVGLYPTIVKELPELFMSYAAKGSQVIVTTNSPQFLDGTPLDFIYMLENGSIKKFKETEDFLRVYEDGDLPGYTWFKTWQ